MCVEQFCLVEDLVGLVFLLVNGMQGKVDGYDGCYLFCDGCGCVNFVGFYVQVEYKLEIQYDICVGEYGVDGQCCLIVVQFDQLVGNGKVCKCCWGILGVCQKIGGVFVFNCFCVLQDSKICLGNWVLEYLD